MELSPDNLQYLDEQVAIGKFPSRTEAMDEAVQLLRERQGLVETLQAMGNVDKELLKGMASPSSEMTQADWSALKERAKARWNKMQTIQ